MADPHTRPEARALLAGAHSRASAVDHDQLSRALSAITDWEFFVRAASWHHLAGLLHHSLAPHAAHVPADVRIRLRQMHGRIARHNLLLTGEVLRVLRTFEEAGVPVVPLKGPALAALCYKRYPLRPAGDLDFLVPQAHLRAADEVLKAAGYAPASGAVTADVAEAAQLGREYVHPERRVVAELHGYFLNTVHHFDLEPEEVWARLDTGILDERRIPRLSSEDTLLYLCAHGGKHHYERLKWVCDIAELLRSEAAPSWATVRQRARSLRSQRLLWLGCLLAADLLGAPVPAPELRAARADRTVRSMARRVTRWCFTEPFAAEESLRSYWFHLQMREAWRDRRAYLRHLSRLAVRPTAKDRAFLPLPPGLEPLYYAIRPVRLAVDAVTGGPA